MIVTIGFNLKKKYIQEYLAGNYVRRVSVYKPVKFFCKVAPRMLLASKAEFYVWSYREPKFIEWFSRNFSIPLMRVEDGFIRSVALGATGVRPLSICIDSQNLYFDATGPSDLEDILSSYDFDGDTTLKQRAKDGIAALISSKLSKYNAVEPCDVKALLGARDRKRVLVLGQVEGDMSIEKGCEVGAKNIDLVRLARKENPNAQIIYKPHPEVLLKTRAEQSDPREAEPYAQLLYEKVPLADLFPEVDHVYTITSLAGFEALLRGLKVTCLGAPFYSNWGLTDDRQVVSRRTRNLTIEQVFAGSYILYPKYFNPITGKPIEFEEALDILARIRAGEVREIKT